MSPSPQTTKDRKAAYAEQLAAFLEEHCEAPHHEGSCHGSGCPWASPHGCLHPKHPRHTYRREPQEAPDD